MQNLMTIWNFHNIKQTMSRSALTDTDMFVVTTGKLIIYKQL